MKQELGSVEFMNVEEVARYLGVWRKTVYGYIKDVKRPLPAMKISKKKIIIRRKDLIKWMADSFNKMPIQNPYLPANHQDIDNIPLED